MTFRRLRVVTWLSVLHIYPAGDDRMSVYSQNGYTSPHERVPSSCYCMLLLIVADIKTKQKQEDQK